MKEKLRGIYYGWVKNTAGKKRTLTFFNCCYSKGISRNAFLNIIFSLISSGNFKEIKKSYIILSN